jgi:hypothetical protein
MTQRPRITLISALAESPGPAGAAMRKVWPEAAFNNLIDDSLASDLAASDEITREITERFLQLGRYAAGAHGSEGPTRGILFTCSAFGPAIARVKADLVIPVVAPNEGAFEAALDICARAPEGGHVGLVVSFAGSAVPLSIELMAMADARRLRRPTISIAIAQGALEALQHGDAETHDRLVAEAAQPMPKADVTVIGQFSMARAASLVAASRVEPVLTTPEAAVRKLRRLVLGDAA